MVHGVFVYVLGPGVGEIDRVMHPNLDMPMNTWISPVSSSAEKQNIENRFDGLFSNATISLTWT